MSKPKAYFDLHGIDEDERIDFIGNMLLARMAIGEDRTRTGVLVDDDPGKSDRYAKKLMKKFPGLKVVSRHKGPTAGVVTLIVEAVDESRN